MNASKWIYRLMVFPLIPLLFLIPGLVTSSREANTTQRQFLALALADEGHGKREKQVPPEGHPAKEPHEHEVPHQEAQESQPGGVRLSPVERANIGLKVVPAEFRPLEDVRLLNGVVKPHPDRVALVSSRLAGRAVAIHVKLGDRVKKEQDLADVQSVELEKIELGLIQAENQLSLAQSDLERTRSLVEKGIAAKKDLLAAENKHRAVVNEIESLTRQLSLLGMDEAEIRKVRREKTISTLHIHAPLAGTIVERRMILGQTVEPNTHLFKIVDTSTMIVEGEAFEDILPLLKEGQRVRVTVAPYPGEVFQGRITFISPTLDPEKRTIHLWAEVKNHHRMLKEGLFAKLSVAVRAGSRALTIPADAVLSDQGEKFVFVEKGETYQRADVFLGARSDLYVEVTKGLKPGDRVVTEGKMQLYAKYLSATRGAPALGGHGHGGHAH